MNHHIDPSSFAPPLPVSARVPLARRRGGGQRGASLIEIMVVLVILLTGVFLVIRIFPVGFGTLRAHENRTNSVRLAEQLLGQVRTDAVNLPQGVLMGYQEKVGNYVVMKFITDQFPDRLAQFCGKDPATGEDFLPEDCTNGYSPYFSDINKFRLIRGESVKIPLPTTATDATGNTVTGSVYPLRFGPVFMDETAGNANNAPDIGDAAQLAYYNSYLAVKSAPLTRVSVESSDGANTNLAGFIRSPQTYLIDYGGDGATGYIMFQPRAPRNPARAVPERTFLISYTYEDSSGLQSVNQVAITVPDSFNAVWQTIPTGAGMATDVSPGSDVVTRAFTRLKKSDAFDANDPYEYKLVSDNIAPNGTATNANFGVLNFNPSGATYSENTSYGQRAFTAYVDYAVLDWHIIHEDRDVPSAFISAGGGLVPVRTTLAFIKRYGDTDSDNSTYNGLYNVANDANKTDIQIFNLDDPTGTPLVAGDYNNTANTPNADYFIDDDPRSGTYRTGTIYVNTARLKSGVKLRILYKAEGDWAVSLQKAYDTYSLATSTAGGTVRANYITSGNFDSFAVSPGKGANAQIRLPYTDLNKAFLVTIQYVTAAGVVKRLSPIQMVADGDSSLDTTIEDPAAPGNGNDKHFAYIDVSKYLSGDVNKAGEFLDATDWYPYGTIRGVSAKARVIYHDNNNTTNSWRIQDLDTFLTPAAAEDVK